MMDKVIGREIMVKDKEIRCKKCGKKRVQFSSIRDYCQTCYRKMLDEYSYYGYRIEKDRIKGTALRVCEMLIEEGKDKDEIHKELGLNRVYVNQIVNRYTERVNSKGERRPF